MTAGPKDWKDPALGGVDARRAALQRLVGEPAIEQPRFPGQHVEPHLLVQEPDQPVLGHERRPVTVALLAQRDDPGRADERLEWLQVAEVFVFRVDGVQGHGVFLEPAGPLILGPRAGLEEQTAEPEPAQERRSPPTNHG